MASRVITALVTGGMNVDCKEGAYVRFGEIYSDTGAVANATPVSATLYLSSYRTYTPNCKLNVIFGGSNDSIVATTANALESNANSHDGTHALTNLSASLLTSTVSRLTLGIISDVSSQDNHLNIRGECTMTLTIEYKKNQNSLKYYNGSSWVECVPHYYDGSRWVHCNPYYYDGSAWRECSHS